MPDNISHDRLLTECVVRCSGGDAYICIPDESAWRALIVASVRHGVAQPIARMLLSALAERLSNEQRRLLSRLIEANRERNLALYAEAEEALDALRSVGIEALVLKGVGLSLTSYPDFALRSFADVDILVRPLQFETARAALVRSGWALQRAIEPGHHHAEYERYVDRDILTWTLAPEYDASLTPEALVPHSRRVRLELHRSPFYDVSGLATNADLGAFWEGAIPSRFPSGGRFLTPSLEAQLIHLCAHAASHVYNKAQFALDVHYWLRKFGGEIDLARLRRVTDEYRASTHIRRMLAFVEREMPAPRGRAILDALGGPIDPPLTWGAVFVAHRSTKSENRLRQWADAGSARERISGAARMLFPSPAAMRRIYPGYHRVLLAPLYFWRPFQLAGRLARVLATRVTSRHSRRPTGEQREISCPGSQQS